MGSQSKLARLQQVTTLSVVAGSLAWLAWQWPHTPFRALIGFVLIAMGYSVLLAIEFIALRWVDGGPPRPSGRQLAIAWLGETAAAARVFGWRQPFRWRAVPDQVEPAAGQRPRRGVVFIHGFVCNRGFWTPWLHEMRRLGHSYVAVNLEPVFGSIDHYVAIVEEAVERITNSTGMAPVVVCHSMGGLAARAWLRAKSADTRVHRVVTIGSPHHGTWLGRFSRVANGRQMRPDSDWLRRLGEPSDVGKFTCWYSNCDNIVFPVATATLPGADNRLVVGVAHVALAFHPRVMSETLDLIAS